MLKQAMEKLIQNYTSCGLLWPLSSETSFHYNFGGDVTWKQHLFCVCIATVSLCYRVHVGPSLLQQLNAEVANMENVLLSRDDVTTIVDSEMRFEISRTAAPK